MQPVVSFVHSLQRSMHPIETRLLSVFGKKVYYTIKSTPPDLDGFIEAGLSVVKFLQYNYL